MGLIPKVDSLPNFCTQSYHAQFQQYRCIELGAQAGQHTLREVCEKLIGSMSAFIHNGAVCEYHLNLHHRYTHAFNSMIHCYLVLIICICINQQLATVIKLERMAHLAVNSVDSVSANQTLLVGAVIPVLL